MASKKSVRKVAAQKPLKEKNTPKKKPVAKKSKAKLKTTSTTTKKKAKVTGGKKSSAVPKKPKVVAKPAAKKKAPVKAAARKKKVVAKKVLSKKKATPKKSRTEAVSKLKAKKTVQKTSVVQKKNKPIAKKKTKPSQGKKPLHRSTTSSDSAVQRVSKLKEPLLSSTERYNIGGLFACAIERRNDPDYSRLRAVLRHLDLYPQEKDNLIRLSEGFMIPKLFAENLPEPKVNQLLADLVKFSMREESYEKYWREEIQQIGFWLGVFPAQFQAIEHQVKR